MTQILAAPRKLIALMAVLSTASVGLGIALVLLLAGVVQSSQHAESKSTHAESRSTAALKEAAVAKDISEAIQAERKAITRQDCEAQDHHHRAAVRTLDRLLVAGHPLPKAQRRKTRADIRRIASAFAPLEDCAAKALQVTGH